MATSGEARGGYSFGTFQGVFTPSILTIIGVVMYLRFGWVLGNVGLVGALALVAIGSAITFLTGLSISTLATNMRMKGGGAYFMLSRSLGLESGAALGIPLALSQAVGVSFYIVGFAEALTQSGLPESAHVAAFAGVVRTAVRERRNVMLVAAAPEAVGEGRLDIWWRGGGDNGALMLALALLLRRDEAWGRLSPRVNMLIRNRTPDEARRQLAEFLVRARIEAESRILEMGDVPFTQALAESSSDAALSLIGLRPPREGETDAEYGDYLGHIVSELADVPSPVFVLAASELGLERIFA